MNYNLSKYLFFIILFHIINSGFSQDLNDEQWIEDLDYLKLELPKNHYNLFAIKDQSYFNNEIENMKYFDTNFTDLNIAIRLQQLVANMGDSHTKIGFENLMEKEQVLPLHLYWFSDGLYILKTTDGNKEILGNRIISINDIPVQTVINSLSTLITIDNHAIIKSNTPKLLPKLELLKYFGFTDNNYVELGSQDEKGNIKKYLLKSEIMDKQNAVHFEPNSLAYCYLNERKFFVDNYMPEDSIYYIQYNRCWSKELENKYYKGKNADKMPSFGQFQKKVFKTLNTKPVNKFVFDMRFNGGGSSPQGTEFIQELDKFANNNPKMKIYVVLGRHTFSSAILNAMDFKKLKNATFVGEETGGKPNHFGEVRGFTLPNSKLEVNYSTKYFKRTDDDPNSLQPDVTIETSFNDFKDGIDPIYEWIKQQ